MSMRRVIGFLGALVLIATPALAGKGDAAAGKAAYTKRCATCHGPDGKGKDAIAKMFKVKMLPLGSKEVQAKTDEELRKGIVEGKGKMPPVKDLSEADVSNIIAFVRTLAAK